ncbi:MAG: efflux RND transporter periplasmic adaptor subunit [bacterium]
MVEPARQAQISARVTAAIEEIKVDEGDRVKAGDILAELDAKEVKHSIEAASARIEQAEAELAGNRATVEALEKSRDYWQAERKRALALAEKKALSESETEQTEERLSDILGRLSAAREKSRAIKKQIKALEKQKAELSARRNYYILKSPFDGVVTRRSADPGDMAAPSKNLFTVQDQSKVKLAFDVPQKDLPRVNKGEPAVFKVNNRTRKAEITLMYPAIDKAKMMRAEILPKGEAAADLVPGAYVEVTVIAEHLKDVVMVPASALIESPEGKTHVFAADGDSISAVSVEILGRSGDRAAVSGIDAETRVVENTYLGWTTLSSGQKVEVVE